VLFLDEFTEFRRDAAVQSDFCLSKPILRPWPRSGGEMTR
jgi:hypothetical protein